MKEIDIEEIDIEEINKETDKLIFRKFYDKGFREGKAQAEQEFYLNKQPEAIAKLMKIAKDEGKAQTIKDIKEKIEKWRNDLFAIVDYHKDTGSGEIIMKGELVKKTKQLLSSIEGLGGEKE